LLGISILRGKATTDNMSINGYGYVPVMLYL
jgi:hypothetical protein